MLPSGRRCAVARMNGLTMFEYWRSRLTDKAYRRLPQCRRNIGEPGQRRDEVVVRLETAYRLGAGGYSRIQDPEERKADYRGDLQCNGKGGNVADDFEGTPRQGRGFKEVLLGGIYVPFRFVGFQCNKYFLYPSSLYLIHKNFLYLV